MNLVLSSILAPVAAAVPVVIGAVFAMFVNENAETLILILLAGWPLAIVLCFLGATILHHKDLFETRYTYLYCGLIGALIASAATLGFFGLGLVFWGVTVWGFLSGIVFRRMLGDVSA